MKPIPAKSDAAPELPADIDGAAVLRGNLAWFAKSGVMRPADGFWGVAERIAVMHENTAAGKIATTFPCLTELRPGIMAVEHRRTDCVLEVALLHDLASVFFQEPEYRNVADRLVEYLVRRSGLRNVRAEEPTRDLWGWAAPTHSRVYWTDDNAWAATLLLILGRRQRPELIPLGLATAEALYRTTWPFLRHVADTARRVPFAGPVPLAGLKLNPHWLGLVTLALAHAAAVDNSLAEPYGAYVEAYHRVVLDGPMESEPSDRAVALTDLPWSLSEYAYLSLTATICAQAFPRLDITRVARTAVDILLAHEAEDGHLHAEHAEAPAGSHLADLIYTDNWAVLGLLHAARLFPDAPFRAALQRKLRFLTSIQDPGPDPVFAGCWRGMYDTKAGTWGGGDRFEGGAGSVYSGWTNAPIAWAFLFAAGADSLFPYGSHL